MLPVKTLPYVERGLNFCEQFQTVTILFSDIVSYTNMAAQMEPMAVVNMLNELYFMYDRLVEKNNVYKVETIGDAFMCAGGVPDAMPAVRGAEAVANMALDMIEVGVAPPLTSREQGLSCRSLPRVACSLVCGSECGAFGDATACVSCGGDRLSYVVHAASERRGCARMHHRTHTARAVHSRCTYCAQTC